MEMPIFNGATMEDRYNFYKTYLRYCSKVKERAVLYKDTNLKPMSIRSCMENDDVILFIWALDLNLNSEADLTDDVLLKYFKEAKLPTSGSVGDLKAEVENKLRLDINIQDAVSRATKLKKDFFLLLVKYNLRNFWSDYPKESVRMILDIIHPVSLRKLMENKIQMDKKLLKNFHGFFSFLADQLEHVIPFENIPDECSVISDSTKPPPSAESDITQVVDKTKTLVCIYGPCNGNHHLKDCEKCPDAEKSKLLAEFRKTLPPRHNQKLDQSINQIA